MGAYRNAVAADNPYWHYEFNNDYTDSEGVAPTGGTNYGGTVFATFVSGGLPDTSSHYLDFSGSVDSGKYLSSTSNAVFSTDLDDNDAQSLELWYEPTAIRTSGTCNLIRHDGERWWMRTDNAYISVQINTDNNTSTQYYFADSSTQLQNNTLYHIVWTWDGDKIRIYINGELKATSSSIPGALKYTVDSQTYVGSPGGESANGYIDEIAMYRSTLSLAEIQDHYIAGGGVLPDVTVTVTGTNIAVAGKPATVDLSTPVTVNAVVTDVDIAGQAATVSAETNVSISAVVTNIAVEGKAPTLAIQGNVTIPIDVTDIDLTANPATVTAEVSTIVNAVVTDVNILGIDSQNLYPSLVFTNNPTHYWKFTLQDTEYVIKDFVSGGKDGAIVSTIGSAPYTATNLDADSFISGINSDFGSNAILLNGTITGSTSTSTRERVQFTGDQPTIIGDNLTYEIWFKTSNSEVELLVFDSPNYESSVYFTERKTALGILGGKLSIWQMPANETEWDERTNIITHNQNVNDNNWHHLMMTKSTSGSTTIFKSYLDGVETATVLSLGTLLQYAALTTARDYFTGTYTVDETDTLFYIGNAYGGNYGGNAGVAYSVSIDDVAIYETALTLQDAINRYGAGAGTTDVTVEPVVTDIEVSAGSPVKPATINVSKSNISVKSNMPGVSDGTNVNIGSTAPKIDVNGKAPTVSLTAVTTINVTHGEVSIAGKLNKVSTNINFFKFISSTDTALSAQDAEGIESLDFAGMLFNQEKKLLFRIGNTNNVKSTFNISIDSRSTDILGAIKISTDNINYYDTLTIENVNPNDISEMIYVKFTSNFVYLLGPGSFLINVEQINV